MILTNREFTRKQPSRSVRKIYIFPEGKRECNYFKYFQGIESRVNIIVTQLEPTDDNSPSGLLRHAKSCLLRSEENPYPKYEFAEGDEVWIVLDTDIDQLETRRPQIRNISDECEARVGWNIVESNPCFEVWLFYHISDNYPTDEELTIEQPITICSTWKRQILPSVVPGGFDSRKHPIYIAEANSRAKEHYQELEGIPTVASTQVYQLGESLYQLAGDKIDEVRKRLEL